MTETEQRCPEAMDRGDYRPLKDVIDELRNKLYGGVWYVLPDADSVVTFDLLPAIYAPSDLVLSIFIGARLELGRVGWN